MSFWDNVTGEVKEVSFDVVPDGTQARAQIQEVELTHYQTLTVPAFFRITWQLVDGACKGSVVKQNLKVFDEDENAATKARNMLTKIFEVCKVARPVDKPNLSQLIPLQGKIAGIKIREYVLNADDGTIKNGNWIANVVVIDSSFESKLGNKIDVSAKSMSSASKRSGAPVAAKKPEFDDDITF